MKADPIYVDFCLREGVKKQLDFIGDMSPLKAGGV